tara:strand:+ start:2295 stop:2558 length:264 start_codon:yes stop_codon:yes gene_type:complete
MCLKFFRKKSKPSIKILKVEKIIGECPICFEYIIVAKNNLALPCGHVFHEACIKKWTGINNSCPLCTFTSLEPHESVFKKHTNDIQI